MFAIKIFLITPANERKNMDDEQKDPSVLAEDAKTCECSEKEEEKLSLKYENKKEVFKGGILGAFIGLAIIVPGVSGSVVAIILRLYEKLLYALGNLLKEFKKCVKFLIPIAIGAVVGLAVGFLGVKALLSVLPFAIVALFAGLMLGAFPAVTDQLKGEKVTVPRALLFAIGFLVPIAISAVSIFVSGGGLPITDLKFYHYIIFAVVGFAISVTQLAPGLSATAFLMILGCYTPIINSISLSYWQENPQIFILYACLIVGFLVGLIAVSKWLSVLFEKKHAPSFFTVAGLSLGSTISMFFNSEIMETYTSWGESGVPVWQIILGVALFAIGVFCAYMFVRYERKHGVK